MSLQFIDSVLEELKLSTKVIVSLFQCLWKENKLWFEFYMETEHCALWFQHKKITIMNVDMHL